MLIAKHVAMRSLGKSDFAGLVAYISDAQHKAERLGAVRATNCEAGTQQAAIGEVLATQHLNTRAKGDKTYHLLVSFRAGETPSADTLKAIEERLCAGLGYAAHQRISAVHHDTDNLHIHIAINKIHPARHTMHEPYYPHRALAALCTALEREYGLEPDNHGARKNGAQGRAADMEQHAGIQSLVGWIKRECLDELQQAQSWKDLHQRMRANGLELRERGNGLVIEAGDGTTVRASTVARAFSKAHLEARLGPFEPSSERPSPRRMYRKQPVRMRINTAELYARYQAEQKSFATQRAQALAQAKRRKDRAVEDAKRANRLRRATVKIVDGRGIDKRVLYRQAHAALRARLDAIHKDYASERARLYRDFTRHAWADWLKQEAVHGNAEALAALRARAAARGLQGNTVQAEGQARAVSTAVLDNITKKGTLIFRVGRSAVRDDGDRLQVSREATPEALRAALRLAMDRYGERISVSGSPVFKAQIVRAAVASALPITFTDAGLERRRRELLTKETPDERDDPHLERGRVDRPGASRAGHPILVADSAYTGGLPPPPSRNRLRTLSALGVVRFARGSEVLLPGDVSRDVEQHRTEPDHALRRDIPALAPTPAQLAAVDKYIGEREQKRLDGFDIPKHSRYTAYDGVLLFAGLRHVDGQSLALLKRDESVMVLSIDHATAQRAARMALGQPVSVTPRGSLKASKGRSR